MLTRTVYVVQHPEATHHKDGVVGGWFDSVLTSAGEQDAVAIADRLRNLIPPDATPRLFSSDLRRAGATADIIGQRLAVEPAYDRRLREKSYGAAEGRPQSWFDERLVAPPAAGDRLNHVEVDGAESRADVAERVYAAMDSLLVERDQHLIVVTHGSALTYVVAHWIRMPISAVGYARFRGAPGSITVLHEDDRWHDRTLLVLGDTTHLDREHTTTEH